MKSTAEIRKEIRAARRAVGPTVRAQKSSLICKRFYELDSYKTAKHIGAYLAFDGEADPMELMIAAAGQGKQVYLPIIVGKSEPLLFAPWTPETNMVKNQFKILEPDVDPSKRVPGSRLDFVVNPLVAFDARCNRIGVGGGFYDRTFAFLNEPDKERSVKLVGFAFELQKLKSIESQPWDVRLDSVATESNLYR